MPFYSPNNPENQNFLKNENSSWRYYFTHVYYKWKSYDVWFLRNVVQQTEFFLILDHFCPFTPLATQATKILKNYKKMPGDLILHTCTINDNQMMYCSWDIKHDRENFSVILSHFLSFYSTKNQKNLNFEKNEKKAWRYHHFTQVYQKSWL